MSGDRISDMTHLASLPASGARVPVIKDGDTSNYSYDLAADLAARPTSAALAAPSGTSLLAYLPAVGLAPVNLQTALRLGLPIAPEFIGAVGDGVTDDHAAIQAAIDYLVSIGGGTLRFAAKTYKCSAPLTWNGAGITLEGAGANVQALSSAINTILLFPNSATQTGCINPKNGSSGLGFGSRVRNLVIKGNNGTAVSAANAKLGLGSGLLAQVYGIFENVIAMHCEGNGIYALSAPSISDNAIACNGAIFTNCIGYGCGNNGRATYGVDSNTLNFYGGGALNNTQFGDYINGLQGSSFFGPSYEGNLGGALRFGDTTSDNRVYGATKQGDVALTVQFDLGGSAQNLVDFQSAEGTPGNADYVITDNTAAQTNDVIIQGVRRTARMGGNGAVGTVNVNSEGGLVIGDGLYVLLQDSPLTANWKLKNLGGKVVAENGGVQYFGLDANGFGYTAAGAGVGGSVTQATSRTTGVTVNKPAGAITLFSAAGSATWNTFTVTDSCIAATDTVRVCQKSGTDKYMIHVTGVRAGAFDVSFATTGGTTTEQPVFNFAVIKAVAS